MKYYYLSNDENYEKKKYRKENISNIQDFLDIIGKYDDNNLNEDFYNKIYIIYSEENLWQIFNYPNEYKYFYEIDLSNTDSCYFYYYDNTFGTFLYTNVINIISEKEDIYESKIFFDIFSIYSSINNNEYFFYFMDLFNRDLFDNQTPLLFLNDIKNRFNKITKYIDDSLYTSDFLENNIQYFVKSPKYLYHLPSFLKTKDILYIIYKKNIISNNNSTNVPYKIENDILDILFNFEDLSIFENKENIQLFFDPIYKSFLNYSMVTYLFFIKIPKEKQTNKIIENLIPFNPHIIEYVRDDLKTEKLCQYVIEYDYNVIQYCTPDFLEKHNNLMSHLYFLGHNFIKTFD